MPDRNKADRNKVDARKPSLQCPLCRRPAEPDFRPFCSRRCAEADLGRWLTGGYRIPGPAVDEEKEGDPQRA